MSSFPATNSNVPQIAHPVAEAGSLVHVAESLKQGVDSLAGNRGTVFTRAVTFNDLISLGIVSRLAIDSFGNSGFATTDALATESAERIAALGGEAAVRVAADAVLQAAISAEAATRAAADAVLHAFIIAFMSPIGVLINSQVFGVFKTPVAVTFPANFGGIPSGLSSGCECLVKPTAGKTVTIQKCPVASDPSAGGSWSAIGTAVFLAGGFLAAMASAGGIAQTLAVGDLVRAIGPAAADATLSLISLTLVGVRA